MIDFNQINWDDTPKQEDLSNVEIRKVMIRDKLLKMGYPVEGLSLGDYDQIGEFTAKKNRDPSSKLYSTVGCFFRPNYERGILLYHLVKKHSFSSVLEIGFGRGYGTFCMAKSMVDNKIDGKITTVDPNLDQGFIEQLTRLFPREWFEKIDFARTDSSSFFKEYPERKFDFSFLDGDHRYDQVKKDWEYCKKNVSDMVLFDDYHLPTKSDKDIEVSRVVNKIDEYEKELIIMDRRIFLDDRGLSDDEIDYGQVLVNLKNKN